jgi:hypothetical protein
VRGRIAEDEASEAIPSICAQPDSSLPAHRKTAEICVANFDRIQKRKNIVAELFLRIRSGRNGGKAVAASVITENSKYDAQRGDLRVPHRQICAQRIGEDNYGRSRLPFQAVTNTDAIGFYKRHE